jgi:hypothetical protein
MRPMILVENFKFYGNTCKNKNLRLLVQVLNPFLSFYLWFLSKSSQNVGHDVRPSFRGLGIIIEFVDKLRAL